MNNSLNSALSLAAKGFAVFPVSPDAKHPACIHGAKDATKDEKEITNLFDGDYNIGIEAARSGLIIIDIDSKDGRDGNKAMSNLIQKFGKFPTTLAARTPNKGLHLYYKTPAEKLPNIKDNPIIGEGIEVKADNQYVVAPPSTIFGLQYTWLDDAVAIADCPEWFANLCRQTIEANPKKKIVSITKTPQTVVTETITGKYKHTAKDVIDAFNAANGIESILLANGYSYATKDGFMRHPNADSMDSVNVGLGKNISYHFGAGDPLKGKGGGQDNCTMNPFGVTCEFAYGGDFKAAIKAISASMGMDGKNENSAENVKTNTVIDTYCGSTVEQNNIEINIDNHPDAILQFVSDFASRNSMLSPIFHFGAAYAVLGALIGKVFYAEEQQIIQYPNDWYVNLVETGKAKTGPVTAITDALMDLNMRMLLSGGTMAGMYAQIGGGVGKREWLQMSEDQQSAKMQEIRKAAENKTTGTILVSDECTGTLETLMGGWDSKSPAKDLPALIKLTDSHARIPQMLGGDGYRTIEDACVAFLGYTQNATWQEKFGSEQFKKCGLFGRFIPITNKYLSIRYTPQSGDFKEIMRDTYLAAIKTQQKVKCTFLRPDGTDYIKDVMDAMPDYAPGRKLQNVFPDDYGNLRSKIVVHAIKASMVEGFLRGDHIEGLCTVKDNVDCSPYFAKHVSWITCAYLAYLQQMTLESYTAIDEKRIIGVLRQFSELSHRDIQRKLNFRSSGDLTACLDALVDDGKVRRTIKNTKSRSKKTVAVYSLS